MSNNDFINSLEKKGGIIAIDTAVWNGRKVTILACIKEGNHFNDGGPHSLKCNFFIGYIGKFSTDRILIYVDEKSVVRKPTLTEYLRLMRELKNRKIVYNRKTNKIYESNR